MFPELYLYILVGLKWPKGHIQVFKLWIHEKGIVKNQGRNREKLKFSLASKRNWWGWGTNCSVILNLSTNSLDVYPFPLLYSWNIWPYTWHFLRRDKQLLPLLFRAAVFPVVFSWSIQHHLLSNFQAFLILFLVYSYSLVWFY